LFHSDRFRIVHIHRTKEDAMLKELAREGDVELNASNRKREFEFERSRDFERVQLFEAIDRVSSEAIDRVSSALDQLRSVLDGRRGH
jgi:hypothetical protein